MTDGHLIGECLNDPLLSRYSVIMVDEAHERSLNTDILLGLLKKIQKVRRDLRIIISSATLEADEFRRFFETNTTLNRTLDTCIELSVEGRQHHVDICFLDSPCRDYVQAAVDTALDIHRLEKPGDILIFLTGAAEIDQACRNLEERAAELVRNSRHLGQLVVIPLYSNLSTEAQMAAFATVARGDRKCIIATNIAETSITIPGVSFVVDSCFVKIATYNPLSGIETLNIVPVSHAQATQRAGRAGRERPGRCFRLCTEKDFDEFSPVHTTPEMHRANLAAVLLQIKALGIDNVLHFEFPAPPPPQTVIRALELLYALGALDEGGALTPEIGMVMTEMPAVEPRVAKLLISAAEMGCVEEMLSISAMLCVRSPFVVPPSRTGREKAQIIHAKFAVREGDHLTLLNVFNSFLVNNSSGQWCSERFLHFKTLQRAVEIRRQLVRYIKRFELFKKKQDPDSEETQKPKSLDPVPPKTLVRCLVTAFFSNAAQLQPDGTYMTVRGNQQLRVHSSSVFKSDAPAWVIFHEIVQLDTGRFMREITRIEAAWLSELAPHFYRLQLGHVESKGGDQEPPTKKRKMY